MPLGAAMSFAEKFTDANRRSELSRSLLSSSGAECEMPSVPGLFTEAFHADLADLSDTILNLSHITPFRFRFIDCVYYVKHGMFRLVETESPLDDMKYSAISYVWKALQPPSSDIESFQVAGSLDGDPIGLQTLKQACLMSLRRGASVLWLDRVSVMQTNKQDKAWQIRRMHDIYKGCQCCIVLLDGLQRLPVLEEHKDSNWLQRSWTLQEVVVPMRTACLFASKFG